ncbi:MAG: hypothetical protein B0A82_24915 [Alkalinema sp. CACIAM 70d]|nr:MAG: hypothetical protein B0A82_24915 [Alkalinema sp. CACIAM 70d]
MRRSLNQLLDKPLLKASLLSLSIIGGILLMEQKGVLEPLELRAYDLMVRLRPGQEPDSRLLVVGVTETDLRRLNVATPSDRTLAEALSILQASQPRAIGLDFYRDLPQGTGQPALIQQLQAKNVVAIHRISNIADEQIPPPPGMAPEQIGFNDISIDRDGVVRRTLIFAQEDTSFAMQLAFTYLEKDGVMAEESPEEAGILKLGQSTFWPIESTSGAYRTADTRGHQILLNYRNLQVGRRVTLSQLLDRQVPADWIRNKIILIGNVATSSKDFFYTPYSPGQTNEHQMSGVEVHGQVISQLLDAATGKRPLIWALSNHTERVWIAIWGILSAIIAWRMRRIFPWAIVQASLLAASSSLGFVALMQGLWVPVVAPMVSAIAGGGCVIAYRAQMLQRQNRMAMTLLGQNTSPKVAQTLWENRHDLIQSGHLTGQQVMATMLFSDLRGFSGISENLTPPDLMRWLNEYLSTMTAAIHHHQGVVNKFMGDGIFAVFGVPIARTTPEEIAADAEDAVNCAIEMAERLEKLNQEWGERGFGPIQMRVGICTGTVVVGTLGNREHLEYGVIGDAVNTASRLESCEKHRQSDPCRILISESTQQYLGKKFALEAWGMLGLAGKQQQVSVYRVINHQPTVVNAEAISIP